ncbi:hypothetical protein HDU97_006596 [Phlyctochytrium planicorne]|nr:hypothetical protein HDU97_006596 [Phlyctochytrium planicorne]
MTPIPLTHSDEPLARVEKEPEILESLPKFEGQNRRQRILSMRALDRDAVALRLSRRYGMIVSADGSTKFVDLTTKEVFNLNGLTILNMDQFESVSDTDLVISVKESFEEISQEAVLCRWDEDSKDFVEHPDSSAILARVNRTLSTELTFYVKHDTILVMARLDDYSARFFSFQVDRFSQRLKFLSSWVHEWREDIGFWPSSVILLNDAMYSLPLDSDTPEGFEKVYLLSTGDVATFAGLESFKDGREARILGHLVGKSSKDPDVPIRWSRNHPSSREILMPPYHSPKIAFETGEGDPCVIDPLRRTLTVYTVAGLYESNADATTIAVLYQDYVEELRGFGRWEEKAAIIRIPLQLH